MVKVLKQNAVSHLCGITFWMWNSLKLVEAKYDIFYSYIHCDIQRIILLYRPTATEGDVEKLPWLDKVPAGDGCTNNNMLTSMSEKAKPYTYPCIVQFCILVTCESVVTLAYS